MWPERLGKLEKRNSPQRVSNQWPQYQLEVGGHLHRMTVLSTKKEPAYPLGRVGPRGGLEALEKWKFFTLPGLELRPLGRSPRSQLLYR
jgi:hypothetical protein